MESDDDIKNFYEDIVSESTIKNKNTNVECKRVPTYLQISISFQTPEINRPHKQSKQLTFQYSREFLVDHTGNIVNKTPKKNIILQYINSFDFQNSTTSINENPPEKIYHINTFSQIEE